MLHIFQSPVFAPFAEYPLTQRYSDRKLPPTIFGLTIVVLVLLAVFNIITQGTVPISSSTLLQRYVAEERQYRNTTSCQPALLKVGDSLFTALPNPTTANATARAPGSFKWTVNSLTNADGDPNSIVVPYHGEALSCNMSTWGVTYRLMAQSYNYGMCGKCRAMGAGGDRTYSSDSNLDLVTTTLDLCTNFDLSVDNWPVFTQTVQRNVQAQIFFLSKVYQNLTFGSGDLPNVIFPPYNNSEHSPLGDLAITPRDTASISAWLGGFDYLPHPSNAPPKPCRPHTVCAQGDFVVDDQVYEDTPEAYNVTAAKWASGVALAVQGMGNLQPSFAYQGNISLLPGVLPNMFNFTFGIASYMLDVAVADLNERALAVTYLCTLSRRQWKPPISLLAVVLGNSLGMLGAAMAFMIFVARRWDLARRPSQLSSATAPGYFHVHSVTPGDHRTHADRAIPIGQSCGSFPNTPYTPYDGEGGIRMPELGYNYEYLGVEDDRGKVGYHEKGTV